MKGVLKANCDDAFKRGNGGGTPVMRDSNRVVVGAAAQPLWALSRLEQAKFAAALLGL